MGSLRNQKEEEKKFEIIYRTAESLKLNHKKIFFPRRMHRDFVDWGGANNRTRVPIEIFYQINANDQNYTF